MSTTDFDEQEAERGFFWSVLYMESCNGSIFQPEWDEYFVGVGTLRFDDFWEIFHGFQDYIRLPPDREPELELFVSRKIWEFKMQDELRIIDPLIRNYLIGQRFRLLCTQLN